MFQVKTDHFNEIYMLYYIQSYKISCFW